MKKDPIYLGPSLTRDYIDRRRKVREFEKYGPSISMVDLVTCWVVLIGVMAWIVWLLWW